jgi:hypothetical protein
MDKKKNPSTATVKKAAETRKIQPAPKTGKISRENIKRAVKSVSESHKKP